MTYIYNKDELYHFGIKGQKWGVRNYQNPDGSYTSKGQAENGGHGRYTSHLDKNTGSKKNFISSIKNSFKKYNNDGTLTEHGKKKYSESIKIGSDLNALRYKKAMKKNADFSLVSNGKKIGNLFLEDHGNDLYINWININKTNRGKGFATATMNYVVKYAQNNGYKSLTLEVPDGSEDARHIYEKIGFKAGKYNSEYGLTDMKKIIGK